MKCKNCGGQINGTETFCPYCGTPGRQDASNAAAHKGVKRHKRLAAVLASVAVLLCGVCCFWIFHVNQQAQGYIGTEKGTALTEEEAEQILLSDITDEDWAVFDGANEALSQIVSQYTNGNGYIDADDAESVINAVAAKVDELYEDGVVTYYYCDEEGVSFEYASGLTAFYQPEAEGYASGGDEISILSFSPFENEDNWNTAYTAGTFISDSLDVENFSWVANEDVTIGLLKDQSTSDFFLWNGHGNYVHIWGSDFPVLQTGQASTDRTDITDDMLSTKEVTTKIAAILWFEDGAAYDTTDKWCITPFFVENRLSMNKGMAYLLACQSGRDDKLAAAFANIGAEVSFVHVGTGDVRKWYANHMMRSIIAYMAGEIDGIYHTADEALELSNSYWTQWFIDNGGHTAKIDEQDVLFDTLTEYIEGAQGGTHVEVRGTGVYTLCACIRGTVSFEDGLTEDEIANITGTLSVELETEDGEFVKSTTLSSSEFYFNDLEPGNYYVSLYQNGKIVSGKQEVTVQAHRYASVALPYSALVPLEGYVYNTAGEALSGVSVSAELVLNPELYSANAVTDSDGYYRIEIFGTNGYTLSYTLDGYSPAENSVNVTAEMYSNAQKGVATQLDDVILTKEGSFVYLEDMAIIASDRYTDNQGDSFISVIGTRNGTVDIYGNQMDHGLEAWIARWNFKEEKSWAWVEYSLGAQYYYLTGKITIVADGYNTEDFSSKIEIYGDGELIYSLDLYPGMGIADVELNIENVDILRIYVYDTEYAKGGTSFGLWDFGVSNTKTEGSFDPSDVPIGAVEFNSHYYYLYDFSGLSSAGQNTWENALVYCQSLNGYLATITSEEENEFLFNYIKECGYESAYFGLTDSAVEGSWMWCNGETVSYTNWASGEPGGGTRENYGMFYYKYPNGTWNDGDFKDTTINNGGTAFICEWGEYEVGT